MLQNDANKHRLFRGKNFNCDVNDLSNIPSDGRHMWWSNLRECNSKFCATTGQSCMILVESTCSIFGGRKLNQFRTSEFRRWNRRSCGRSVWYRNSPVAADPRRAKRSGSNEDPKERLRQLPVPQTSGNERVRMLLLPALRPSINRTGFDGAIINVRKRKLKKKTDRTRRERERERERKNDEKWEKKKEE